MAVLGPAEGGKSTLLGVLTQGELDNGRGRARLNLFRHLHEIQSGRTSSISHEILGFSASGEVRDHWIWLVIVSAVVRRVVHVLSALTARPGHAVWSTAGGELFYVCQC